MTQAFGYKHQPSLLSPFLHMLTILKKQVKAQTYCRASQSLPLRESGIKGEPSHIPAQPLPYYKSLEAIQSHTSFRPIPKTNQGV